MTDRPSREQILAEPAGAQLDAWVAELVMGWRRGRFSFAFYDTDGKEMNLPWSPEESGDYYACNNQCDWFRPSTDIRAAWEVVEKVRQTMRSSFVANDFRPLIQVDEKNGSAQNLSGSFELQGWRVEGEEDGNDRYFAAFEVPGGLNAVHARAATAPVAICRAALLACLTE